MLLPFSPFRGIIWRYADKNGISFIDVGCNTGGAALSLRASGRHGIVVGLDRYWPHLVDPQTRSMYQDRILADMRYLPLRAKSFDIVLCIDVIEHLLKNEGRQLLESCERIANRQVILSTPVGFTKMHHEGMTVAQFDLEEHRSGWLPEELRTLGYAVKGDCGPKLLPRQIAYWLSFILPITLWFPGVSYHMICEKKVWLNSHAA